MRKRVIVTFFVSVVTAFGMAWLMFIAVTTGMGRSNKDHQGKLNEVMKGTEAHNVLFMGSSRVFVQIDPVLFDSLTGANSYNAGTDGVRIAEIEVLMRHYLQSHPAPGVVFLNVEETTLKNTAIWDFPRWFPFISSEDVFALSRFQHEIKLAKYLPPVALTYYDDPKKSLGLQGMVRSGEPAFKKTKGYNPLAVAAANDIEPVKTLTYYSDEQGIATFNRVLDLCAEYKIKPVVIVPPQYMLHADTSKAHEEFKDLLAKLTQGIHLLDYSADTAFFKKELYRDVSHLNKVGGAIYTGKIAEAYRHMQAQADTLSVN